MSRLISPEEIENLIDFIEPNPDIPPETAATIVEQHKNLLRKQLKDQKIYPTIIPTLKECLKRYYYTTLIQAGESVGIICAQSIGEKNTQTTLNSIDWKENLVYTKDKKCIIQPIGKMIDQLLYENPSDITTIPENRTEYLALPPGYMIPSCDEYGMVDWYRIEAVTKHLPVGKLVKILTQSGRTVMATQAKSFLVWNGETFMATKGSDIKVGDIVPTTTSVCRPQIKQDFLDLETLFSKKEFIFTDEIIKSRKHRFSGKEGWLNKNGTLFTLPYNRPDTCFGKRKAYFLSCPPGLIYMPKGAGFVSHISSKIPLDNDFGFLIGIYLADGWSTLTFVGISNQDPVIRKRITDFCDKYNITYHLVISKGRNGESHDLKIHSTLLAKLFKIICDTGSSNKKVPEFAYLAPDMFIIGLLDGYISGDGCINKKDGSIIAGSVSKELLLGISYLLSYFDIFGKLSSAQTKTNNVGSKNIKLMHTLRISNSFAQTFVLNITLTHASKQQVLIQITSRKDYKYLRGRNQEEYPHDRDVYFDPIISIEHVEGTTEWVYDLTVEKTRNFQLWNGLNMADEGVSNRWLPPGGINSVTI